MESITPDTIASGVLMPGIMVLAVAIMIGVVRRQYKYGRSEPARMRLLNIALAIAGISALTLLAISGWYYLH